MTTMTDSGERGAATLPAPPEGRTRPRKKRGSRRNLLTYALFSAPAAVLLAVLSVYPIYILVRMSISDVGVQNLLGSWPVNGLENFVSVFADPEFRTVVVQTIVFVAVVMVATLILGFVAAMLLRRASRVNTAVQTTMIFVWALPPVVVGSLWKFLLSSSGPINTVLVDLGLVSAPVPFLGQPSTSLFCIGLVTVWVGIPFAALVLKSAILDIPLEVWDAAKVDGASLLQTVWFIVLPAIRPTLYILGVLSVVAAFRGFDFIYVMTFGGPGTSSSTIPFLGYLTAFRDYHFGDAAAISVVAMVIVLGLAIAYISAVRKEER